MKFPKKIIYDILDLLDILGQEGGKLVHNSRIEFWRDVDKPFDHKQAQKFLKQIY